MKKFLLLISIISLIISTYAQQTVRPATNIIREACNTAGATNKNVLVIFHASWCGWCHKMDSSILDNKCRKFFQENYVIAHLTVEESPNKKQMENPGAAEIKKNTWVKRQGYLSG